MTVINARGVAIEADPLRSDPPPIAVSGVRVLGRLFVKSKIAADTASSTSQESSQGIEVADRGFQ